MSNIIPFHFNGHEVRVSLDEQGNPWWVLKEVCTVIGLTNPSKAAERLKPSESTMLTFSYDGIPSRALLINEQGLYRLIMRSSKPEAEQFQEWVFGEVLPAIRKTGRYDPTPALDHFPELRAIVELAQSTAEARLLAEKAQADAQEAKTAAAHANENALRARETQSFFTVAEYVVFNTLQRQVPPSAYKACSDHLRLYCLDKGIPFRKIAVGGKAWADEYGFHTSVYAEAFPGWLQRRFSQSTLRAIRTHTGKD